MELAWSSIMESEYGQISYTAINTDILQVYI